MLCRIIPQVPYQGFLSHDNSQPNLNFDGILIYCRLDLTLERIKISSNFFQWLVIIIVKTFYETYGTILLLTKYLYYFSSLATWIQFNSWNNVKRNMNMVVSFFFLTDFFTWGSSSWHFHKSVLEIFAHKLEVHINPNSIGGGGGKIDHATQNLVKIARVCTILPQYY